MLFLIKNQLITFTFCYILFTYGVMKQGLNVVNIYNWLLINFPP